MGGVDLLHRLRHLGDVLWRSTRHRGYTRDSSQSGEPPACARDEQTTRTPGHALTEHRGHHQQASALFLLWAGQSAF